MLERLNHHMDGYVGASLDDFVLEGSDRSLSVAWDRARSKVGRTELRFHDLRHSGLTWSAATGASIAELMRRAGHASQAAALRYQHATDIEIGSLPALWPTLANQEGSPVPDGPRTMPRQRQAD
jgi:integrase